VSRRQAPEDTIDKFLLALKIMISSCNYDSQRDFLLRDQKVVGIFYNDTHEQLLSAQSTLNLKKAVEICLARDSGHVIQMQSGTDTNQTDNCTLTCCMPPRAHQIHGDRNTTEIGAMYIPVDFVVVSIYVENAQRSESHLPRAVGISFC
jgi:hypothetical protein